MVRSLAILILTLTCLTATAEARTRAKATAPQPAPKPVEGVNYEDPNLAYSPDYAADTAITCPKTLKGQRLRECLLKNGLAVSEDISEGTEILPNAASSSYH